jgi:hypothetical protein
VRRGDSGNRADCKPLDRADPFSFGLLGTKQEISLDSCNNAM